MCININISFFPFFFFLSKESRWISVETMETEQAAMAPKKKKNTTLFPFVFIQLSCSLYFGETTTYRNENCLDSKVQFNHQQNEIYQFP